MIRARYLDVEQVVRESLTIRRDAHRSLCLLNQVPREAIEHLAKAGQAGAFLDVCRGVRDDGDGGAALGRPAKHELSWKAGTEVALNWEGYIGESLEHGALAGRLVAAFDDLRQ